MALFKEKGINIIRVKVDFLILSEKGKLTIRKFIYYYKGL